jgi:hypothetical protein
MSTLVLHQSVSEQFAGLEIVIDHQTGAVYASQRALARLIGKHHSVVSRFEEQLIKSGKPVDYFHGQVMTPMGPRDAKLYGLGFIEDLIFKHNLQLARLMVRAGIQVFFYGLAGYEVKAVPKEEIIEAPKTTLYLPLWKEDRELCKLAQYFFQKCCEENHFPAHRAHDYLTREVHGYSAVEAREKFSTVYGDSSIGLNHIHDNSVLRRIAIVKFKFASYETGTWKQRIEWAVDWVLETFPLNLKDMRPVRTQAR